MWRHAIWHVGNTLAEESFTWIISIKLGRRDHLVREYEASGCPKRQYLPIYKTL